MRSRCPETTITDDVKYGTSFNSRISIKLFDEFPSSCCRNLCGGILESEIYDYAWAIIAPIFLGIWSRHPHLCAIIVAFIHARNFLVASRQFSNNSRLNRREHSMAPSMSRNLSVVEKIEPWISERYCWTNHNRCICATLNYNFPRAYFEISSQFDNKCLIDRFVVKENAGFVHDERSGTMVLHRRENVIGSRSLSRITSLRAKCHAQVARDARRSSRVTLIVYGETKEIT